ncbi:recombinase family protein [Rhodococcus fascians]|nr:recombinase family protein [Rhodococcus fascians]MBY3999295.1 recombinase family protein [Rhodococcus fascians]MBY4003796.1 recombinase family protein [Rhodococcus fascians]MBY4009774.1 recombinase family protein [Rhodococcus fascians]MBY4018545.1 recombinase family protein [Rhodococcus fascians]
MMIVFSQLERRLISQRTKDALAIKKAQGVRLGRPLALPQETVDRIRTAHQHRQSLNAIARHLTNGNVPTARGGPTWHASTVRAVLARA